MSRLSRVCVLIVGAAMLGGCGGVVPFSVEALYRSRSNTFEDVRVYAEGMRPRDETARRSNVTVLLRTREGRSRVLRLSTRDGRPFVAEDVADTPLRRNLPIDVELLRLWLPEANDERTEAHLQGEAEEILALVSAAGSGRRADLPPTKHLIRVHVR